MKKNNTSLFSYVNELFRKEKYYESILGYELLEELHPDFPYYRINKREAIENIMDGNNSLLKENFHTPKATLYQKRLRVADIFASMGNYDAVVACFGNTKNNKNKEYLFSRANAYLNMGNTTKWMHLTNEYLKSEKMSPIALNDVGDNCFQKLKKPDSLQSQSIDGPLVTICMSCYNAEKFVEQAVRSILQQTYKNIEFIVFNDCSTDNTLTILKQLAKTDPRMTVIDNKNNQGTYISRNEAFKMAKGEFFTVLDSDDYALPDRIEVQVKHLKDNPKHMGVLTEWVRMKPNGEFVFRERLKGGCYQHEAVATLMIRTEPIRTSAGYWDAVRFAADTEFLFRIRKKYGKDNVPLLKKITAISLAHEDSLTNNPITGINVNGIKGLSPTRIKYRKSWQNWHKGNKNLYIPHPLSERLFNAPKEMLKK